MEITLNISDLAKLKPETRDDILSIMFPQPKITAVLVEGAEDFDWEDVVNFTIEDIEFFVEGCSEQTVKGLRVIAEDGPIIHASLLEPAGITNYGSFQGSCTKRARTVSGNKGAHLLSWDEWASDESGDAGHYAVSATTFQALRQYFQLS